MRVKLTNNHVGAAVSSILLIVYALNLDQFINIVSGRPAYLLWVGAFIFSMPLLILVGASRTIFKSPLSIWLITYNLFAMMGLLIVGDSEIRYEGFVFLMASNLIIWPAIASSKYSYRIPTFILVSVMAVAVSTVLIDYFQPFYEMGLTDKKYLNRAVGVYLDPNAAGAALTIMLLICIPRLSGLHRALLIAITSMAVFLTFSRGAAFLLGYALLGLIAIGVLPRRYFIYVIIGFLSVAIYDFYGDSIRGFLNIESKDASSRIDLILGQGNISDVAQDERFYILSKGLSDSLSGPLFGNGFGYFIYWGDISSVGVSTHNMFVRYMLDFGPFGFIIWLSMIYAVYLMAKNGISKAFAVFIAGFLLILSFLSHNLAEQGWFLLAIVYVTSINSISREGKINT